MSIYTLKHAKTLPGEPDALDLYLAERNIYGSSRVGVENINQVIATTSVNPGNINFDIALHQVVGDKNYEFSNHLGNVLEVITDRKLPSSGDLITVDYYTSDVISFSDYFTFGMVLPGRNGSVSDYRYGFMGYEGDPEIKGEGNSYTTEFRQYDPRIGRWLSIDPVFKHHESPYAAYANNPIWFGDPNGGDTLVMHRSAPIQSYTDYDQTALIYVITFSVIRNGVEEHLDQQMYMIGSAHAAKTGDNGLIKYDYYTLTWQRMENHPNFENTIKMTDNGDGQFIHQGNWGNDFAGCAGVSSSEPELTTYSGDPFVKIINTVDALQDVKDLYNTVNGTDNSLTGDKFILKTDSESHAPQTPKAGEVETLPTSKTATENTQNTEATAPTGHQSKRDEGSAVRAGR